MCLAPCESLQRGNWRTASSPIRLPCHRRRCRELQPLGPGYTHAGWCVKDPAPVCRPPTCTKGPLLLPPVAVLTTAASSLAPSLLEGRAHLASASGGSTMQLTVRWPSVHLLILEAVASVMGLRLCVGLGLQGTTEPC